MAVIPIGAALIDFELVLKGISRFDRAEIHARHAIHFIGQNNAMPMNRAIHRQIVTHIQRHRLAFFPT